MKHARVTRRSTETDHPSGTQNDSCSSTNANENTVPMQPLYRNLDDFKLHISSLKVVGWTLSRNTENVTFAWFDGSHYIAKFQVIVDCSLGFSISIYGWFIPDNHPLYMQYKRSVRFTTAYSLLSTVIKYSVCSGLDSVKESEVNDPVYRKSKFMGHSIQKIVEPLDYDVSPTPLVTIFKRHVFCLVLCETVKCCACKPADDKKARSALRSSRRILEPVKDRAPLSATSRERLAISLKAKIIECKALKNQLEEMEARIRGNSISVTNELQSDLLSIISGTNFESSPMMKLFWQQQQKVMGYGDARQMRWHPTMIRFCLSIALKWPSAYEELGKVLKLPSRRRLRDYNNVIKPKTGFNKDVIKELISITKQYEGIQRYIALLFDETKIQCNLVFD